jgi:hypothetical protein
MLLDLLTSSQTQGVVGAAVASMSMMSSMGPMPMTMASGAPPGNVYHYTLLGSGSEWQTSDGNLNSYLIGRS